MKKIFNRQKELGGKGSGKITPLALHDPAPVAPHIHNSSPSPDGPMKFARPSHDEPDPWVLVSGANGQKAAAAEALSQAHQTQTRSHRHSTSSEVTLPRPPPLVETKSSPLVLLPPGASPPVPGAAFGTQPPGRDKDRDRERDQRTVPKKRAPFNASSILRSLDPSEVAQPTNSPSKTPILDEDSPSSEMEKDRPPEKDKERDRKKGGMFSGERRDRDNESYRERRKDRDRGKDKDLESGDDPNRDISVRTMIGWWSSSTSEDWSLALHICDAAGRNEANAKEAAKSLRKTLKWGDPGPQLSAARLWAILLRNPSPLFIAEATTPKFLSSIEDVLSKPTTTQVVRARVLEVLMGAAYAFPGSAPPSGPLAALSRDKGGGYRALWRKVKPLGLPEEGVPFDTSDPMFTPPVNEAAANGAVAPPVSPPPHNSATTQSRPASKPNKLHKDKGHNSVVNRIIPADEDVRRLFEECSIARGNAGLLSGALAYAKPEDLYTNDVIKEYHSKCMASQTLLVSQIPWATSQAQRLRQHQEEAQLLHSQEETTTDPPHHKSEELLSAILAANQELAESFRIYNDLDRLAEETALEREAEERSKRDVRLDRSQIQYIAEDGSIQMQNPTDGTSGPSRTPSPMPMEKNSPYPSSVHNHSVYNSSHPSLQHLSTASPHPLPLTPGTQNHLAPTRQHLHGPRRPLPRSRSPSPDGRSRDSHDVKPQTRMGSLEMEFSAARIVDDDSSDEQMPIVPSAKALGKRRMAVPEDVDAEDRFDPDDLFKTEDDRRSRSNSLSGSDDGRPTWHNQPTRYAYDALAERVTAVDTKVADKGGETRPGLRLTGVGDKKSRQ